MRSNNKSYMTLSPSGWKAQQKKQSFFHLQGTLVKLIRQNGKEEPISRFQSFFFLLEEESLSPGWPGSPLQARLQRPRRPDTASSLNSSNRETTRWRCMKTNAIKEELSLTILSPTSTQTSTSLYHQLPLVELSVSKCCHFFCIKFLHGVKIALFQIYCLVIVFYLESRMSN